MYNIGDLYPNYGLNTTRGGTLPDREEQRQLNQVDQAPPAAVDSGVSRNMLVVVAAAVVVMVLLGK